MDNKEERRFLLKNNKIIIFLIVVLLLISYNCIIKAKKIHIKGGHFNYNSKNKSVVIKDNAKADYGKYHFHSNKIMVKTKKGDSFLNTPENIKMSPGSISGCNYDKPHYKMKAQRIMIYPKKYFIAYNVVLYEFNGKVPIMYLPVLYISLKDEQKLETEVGYSDKKGWYGRLTYNHSLIDNIPGQFYLDYYQKTGKGYGFKQHFLYNNHHKAYIYYYKQDNKINLEELLSKEMAINYKYNKDDWALESEIDLINYSTYNLLTGNVNIDHKKQSQNFSLNTNYDKYTYPLEEDKNREKINIDFSFDNEIDNNLFLEGKYSLKEDSYLLSNTLENKELLIGLYLTKKFNNSEIGIDYEEENIFESEQDYKKHIKNNLIYNYNITDHWEYNLTYIYEELNENNNSLKDRYSGKSILAYKINNVKFETVFERKEPDFSKDNKVSYYRLPEFNLIYNPNDFSYILQAGRYYEDETGTKGKRGAGKIKYNKKINLFKNTFLNIKENFIGRIYKPQKTDKFYYDPYQLVNKSSITLTNNITKELKFKNGYLVTLYKGESPFNFDQEEISEEWKSEIIYSLNNYFNAKLSGSYDLYNRKYKPIKGTAEFSPFSYWNIVISTEYNPELSKFNENLNISSEYNNDILKSNTNIEYNLNKSRLYKLDNKLTYELKGEWGWNIENNIVYNFDEPDEQRLKKANLSLIKKLHCREVSLNYDYVKDEWLLAYNIKLFPGNDFAFGKKDDETRIRLGLENDLKERH